MKCPYCESENLEYKTEEGYTVDLTPSSDGRLKLGDEGLVQINVCNDCHMMFLADGKILKVKVSALDHLADLCYKKRSVVVPESGPWRKPRPAAFMINLPGAVLLRLFEMGMHVYEKEQK